MQAPLDTGVGRRSARGYPRILWIAPNLNHYKKRFLDQLAIREGLDILVLAGQGSTAEGYRDDNAAPSYDIVRLSVDKRRFAFSPRVHAAVRRLLRDERFDAILIPAEKKHLPLILFLVALRRRRGFRLVTYTHPILRSRGDRISRRDLTWTRQVFRLFDRVIFYTEQAREQAVAAQLVSQGKAAFANNTLDTATIRKWAASGTDSNGPPTLLFIGRLTPRKRPDLLLDHYASLKKKIPDLHLIIIGDGPEARTIRNAAAHDATIHWCGALIDETAIAAQMNKAHAVFVPGESGLSVVHAFAYGKPYMTCDLPRLNHGPEIAYLRDGENGLMLSGDPAADVPRLQALLTDSARHEAMCRSARETAEMLSIENWCRQMASALTEW